MADTGAGIYGREARFYDAIYEARGRDVRREVDFLASVAAAEGVEVRTLCDVACGTGVHLAEWARRGVDVTGVDLSSEMLAVARGRLPDAELVESDMREFRLGREFDLVTCLFSSIAHAGDDAGFDAAFASMAVHVAPGGLLLVEPWITPASADPDGRRDAVCATTPDGSIARVSRSWIDGDDLVLEMAWAIATPAGLSLDREDMRLPLRPAERYLEAARRAGLDARWDDAPDYANGRGLLVARRG